MKRIGISSIIAGLAFIVAMAFAASAYGTPSASGLGILFWTTGGMISPLFFPPNSCLD